MRFSKFVKKGRPNSAKDVTCREGNVKTHFSKNILKVKLPKGFEIVESVDADGMTQTSLSFPFEVIFSNKGLLFADKLAHIVARKEVVA